MNDMKNRLELLELKISKRKFRRDMSAAIFVVICISIFIIIGVNV